MSLLKDNHRFSYSQLTSFSECPFSFYLKYIEGVKEEATNGFAEQGTLIHDLLDKWAKGELKKEQLPKEYINRYPDEVITPFPRMLASKGYAEKSFKQGLEYFENFNEFNGYEIVAAEDRIEMPLKLTDGTERPFVAIIDLVLRDGFSGGLIVYDHKSKSLSTFKREREIMYKQQYLYSYFIHEKYGEWPAVLGFNLFKEQVTDEQEFSMQKYEETMKWATDAIHEIENHDILDWLVCKEQSKPGHPDMYCSSICSMRKLCSNSVARQE